MSGMKFIDNLLKDVEVEWKTLGELVSLRRGTVMSKGYLDKNKGQYPVFSSQTANNGKIGEINTYDFDGEYLTWTTDGANAGTVFHRTGKFSITNVCGLITINEGLPINYKYMFYFLNSNAKKYVSSGMGNPKLMSHQINKILFPIPCPNNPEKSLEIQAEIVRVLDSFSEKTKALTSELIAEQNLRKKQYDHYRDQLFIFEDGEVEWKALSDIANYSKLRINNEKLDEHNYVGVDNLLQNRCGKTISSHIPISGNSTQYDKGDILIGNIRPYLKKIWLADRTGGCNGDVLVISIFDIKIDSEYLYQVLSSDRFFEYNMLHAKGAKMPRGNKQKIMDYLIPVPMEKEKQEHIVNILKKINSTHNLISDSLLHEMKLRQQQYEYYREQLLSFKKQEEIEVNE